MSPSRTSAPRAPRKKQASAPAPSPADSPPFRFYDNRQKYLAFVNTCNEKAVVAGRAAQELSQLHPTPPALRIFDAGMGDATVLSRLMSSVHRYFPTVPLLAVAKEISLEDVRLGLEKMPDRFCEHPHTVLAITNLSYVDAPQLVPHDPAAVKALNWQTVRLTGESAYEYVEQIEALGTGALVRLADEAEPDDWQPGVRTAVRARHLPSRSRVHPQPGHPEAQGGAGVRPRTCLATLACEDVGQVQGREESFRRLRAA